MLRDQIKAETVTAMKAKDKERTAALRLIAAKIKDRDIELRSKKSTVAIGKGSLSPNTASDGLADDGQIIDVLQKMGKQRRESITMYEDGGRDELAAQEKAELAVIEEFLPQQMSDADTSAAIEAIKAELGADGMKDMGRVMGELKKRHGTELDMSKASGLVKAALG